MASSFEKSVKGGTKMKLAAPKSKYVEHILQATRTGEQGVAEIFRTLSLRARDTTWTIVFKSVIIAHLMIREGEPDVTLRYLSESPSKLAVGVSDVQTQGTNIRHYHDYIMSRARSFRDTKKDWVRSGKGQLKQQSVDRGLLRETESVQKQISALLKCELFAEEPENEISLTAFRLLTMDLLVLYHIMNEGTINVLEHYFEMSKVDAERALAIYKTFSRQTEQVVKYLGVARQYQQATRLEIPKLKHAPTSLTASLEEYLNDPDFEINRRQYLAQKEAKRTGKPVKEVLKASANGTSSSNGAVQNAPSAAAPVSAPKGPAPDLMDFFESIEQNQQPMNPYGQAQPTQQAQFQYQQPFQNNQQMPQQTGFDSTNPFAQVAPQQTMQAQATQNFGQQPFQNQSQNQFNPQLSSIPQEQQLLFQQPQQPQQQPQQQVQQMAFATGGAQQPFGQPQLMAAPTGNQSTNPFRQSMMPTGAPFSNDSPFQSAPPQPVIGRQSTNPFARNMETQGSGQSQSSPFSSAAPPAPFGQQQQQPPPPQPPTQPMQPMRTGTNPFARSAPTSTFQSPTTSPLVAQSTGTNPFRQTAFINQQTGQGWQSNQGTMGGLENLNTVPVFPRSVQNPPFQQQQQQPQQPWS